MKTYQTLTLIGGIFGIVVVPIILFVLAMGMAAFSGISSNSDLDPGTLGELTAYSLIITVIVSVLAIVIVFVMKKPKQVGYVLLGLAVIMLVATNISGIITWVLFFVGGISAIKLKQISKTKPKEPNSSIDILKERYAKGEITKKQFDEMKLDLK